MRDFTEVRVVQISGNSKDLDQCIENFDTLRGGQGLLSCDNEDQRMIDQLTTQCRDFIESHQPDFEWCEMEIVFTPTNEEN